MWQQCVVVVVVTVCIKRRTRSNHKLHGVQKLSMIITVLLFYGCRYWLCLSLLLLFAVVVIIGHYCFYWLGSLMLLFAIVFVKTTPRQHQWETRILTMKIIMQILSLRSKTNTKLMAIDTTNNTNNNDHNNNKNNNTTETKTMKHRQHHHHQQQQNTTNNK